MESNSYTCAICHSSYSHPGNFKQHLGKHERETGAITSYFQAKDPANAHLYMSPEINSPQPPSSSSSTKAKKKPSAQSSNSHLHDALQSSFADTWATSSSGQKEYYCDVCGRVFKHSGNYKQHMASHMRVSNIAFPNHLRSALDGSSAGDKPTKCKK